MLRHFFLLLNALLLLALSSAHAGVHETGKKRAVAKTADYAGEATQLYIIQLNDPPALAMHNQKTRRSGVASEPGNHFDSQDEDVRRYINKLQAKQNEMLQKMEAEKARERERMKQIKMQQAKREARLAEERIKEISI